MPILEDLRQKKQALKERITNLLQCRSRAKKNTESDEDTLGPRPRYPSFIDWDSCEEEGEMDNDSRLIHLPRPLGKAVHVKKRKNKTRAQHPRSHSREQTTSCHMPEGSETAVVRGVSKHNSKTKFERESDDFVAELDHPKHSRPTERAEVTLPKSANLAKLTSTDSDGNVEPESSEPELDVPCWTRRLWEEIGVEPGDYGHMMDILDRATQEVTDMQLQQEEVKIGENIWGEQHSSRPNTPSSPNRSWSCTSSKRADGRKSTSEPKTEVIVPPDILAGLGTKDILGKKSGLPQTRSDDHALKHVDEYLNALELTDTSVVEGKRVDNLYSKSALSNKSGHVIVSSDRKYCQRLRDHRDRGSLLQLKAPVPLDDLDELLEEFEKTETSSKIQRCGLTSSYSSSWTPDFKTNSSRKEIKVSVPHVQVQVHEKKQEQKQVQGPTLKPQVVIERQRAQRKREMQIMDELLDELDHW